MHGKHCMTSITADVALASYSLYSWGPAREEYTIV